MEIKEPTQEDKQELLRKCDRCNRWLPISHFGVLGKGKNKYLTETCKGCHWRLKYGDKKIEY